MLFAKDIPFVQNVLPLLMPQPILISSEPMIQLLTIGVGIGPDPVLRQRSAAAA